MQQPKNLFSHELHEYTIYISASNEVAQGNLTLCVFFWGGVELKRWADPSQALSLDFELVLKGRHITAARGD